MLRWGASLATWCHWAEAALRPPAPPVGANGTAARAEGPRPVLAAQPSW